MSKKTPGIALIVVGVVAVVVSLEADALGIGSQVGIGPLQAFGAVAGVFVVAVGAWFWPGLPRSRLLGDRAVSPRPAAAATARGAIPAKQPRAAKRSRGPSGSKRRGK